MVNQVAELLEYLKSTGTGQKKLVSLAKIKATSPDEWLAEAKKAVPEGTWAKIEAYVNSQGPPPPPLPMAVETVVETLPAIKESPKSEAPQHKGKR